MPLWPCGAVWIAAVALSGQTGFKAVQPLWAAGSKGWSV